MLTVRHAWMTAMTRREIRLLDSQLLGHSINSGSFFASSNLLLIAAVSGILFGGEAALRSFDVAQRADAPVRTLSQGQRRRGALSRLALDEQPRHWLLDEPFDALDRDGIERLVALLVANAARGGSVLFTSHQSVALPGVVEFDLEACCEPGSANRAAVRNRDG